MSHAPHPRAAGLFYTQAQLDAARANRARYPLDAAWAWLESPTPEPLLAGAALLSAALIAGLRHRIAPDDANWRDAALNALIPPPTPDAALPPEDQVASLIGWGQAYTQIAGALPPAAADVWLSTYRDQCDVCLVNLSTPVQVAWYAALLVVVGIVFEDEATLIDGVEIVGDWVHRRIRPNGTLPDVLQQADDGRSLARQLSASAALVLAAEAATHAGHDLWAYEQRGVSVRTPALLAAYHSLAPQEWPHDPPLPQDEHDALYRAHVGFLEMLARQIRPYLLQDTLAAFRPIFAPTGGGLTTLTHALPETPPRPPDARRGLLGRFRR